MGLTLKPAAESEVVTAVATTGRAPAVTALPALSTIEHPARATDQNLKVAETFCSRQGEGSLTGVSSFFVRVSGCNLRCGFCDTPYASWNPVGRSMSVAQLIAAVRRADVEHVVLTGGEPMIFSSLPALASSLRSLGIHVTIETAGTANPFLNNEDSDEPICDLLSLSPKLSNSTPDRSRHLKWADRHESRRLPIDTMRQLIDRSDDHQVKFVVDTEDDFDEICSVIDALDVAASHVWIMPQGVSVDRLDAAADFLLPWTRKHGFHYCDRMHIRWYGNRPGT
ncbi:MAG: 7-carboxy-7-deazaguanine synthase QueE [Planctomycetota bacterium]